MELPGLGGLSGTELLVVPGTIVLLFGGKKWREIIDAFVNFRGGGPASPSHPLPADDSVLLNRRRRPPEDSENTRKP